MENMETIFLLLGILTALTNIIVQVLKQVTWDKLPTNIVTLLVALSLCSGSAIAYAQVNCIMVTWYFIGATVVIGFMVAFAAMFGFDKLKDAFKPRGGNE